MRPAKQENGGICGVNHESSNVCRIAKERSEEAIRRYQKEKETRQTRERRDLRSKSREFECL